MEKEPFNRKRTPAEAGSEMGSHDMAVGSGKMQVE